jgi:serine phosphatase RsbU (regulator of sigma subunit)
VALGLIEVNEAMHRQAKELGEQLELGKIAQLSILPERPPLIPGVGLHALYRPVDALGGDFYDYFTIDESSGRYGVFLCDVTGHGVSAALFTVMLKALLGTAGEKTGDGLALLAYLNGKMLEMARHHLATACHAVIDSRQRTILFTSAGHCKPLLVRDRQVSEIPVGGPILAARPDPVFTPVLLETRPGDRILLYTDGLTEEENTLGIAFEDAAFHTMLAGGAEKGAAVLLGELFAAVTAHARPRQLQDDICMIAIDIP